MLMPTETNPAERAVVQTKDGLYYSPRLPFLSCIAAVCCGLQSERDLFSKDSTKPGEPKPYTVFCLVRYGLSPAQTQVLTAAAGNPPPPGKKCLPTAQQLEEIVKVLESELASAQVPAVRVQPKAAFDPTFNNIYPTVLELYRSFVLGELPKPSEDWHRSLRAELTAQNNHASPVPAW
jgi:hypothetical protein